MKKSVAESKFQIYNVLDYYTSTIFYCEDALSYDGSTSITVNIKFIQYHRTIRNVFFDHINSYDS
jgi:hypothetical protein